VTRSHAQENTVQNLIRPTLVMGARDGVGRLVLDRLVADGIPVRASTRRPESMHGPDGVDVVAADLTDRASLTAAFAGIEQVFLFAQPHGVSGVIEAARLAGLSRLVLLSSGAVIHPSSTGNPIAEEHRMVEDAFAAADDLTVVPIRPLVLASNALWWSREIRATGSVALYRPDALTAPVHERDVAEVAAAALSGRDDVSAITGSERLSQRAQVAAIAAARGEAIAVVELSRPDASARLSRFMPADEADAVLRFLDDAADGNSIATGAVEAILGRRARPFTDWARDHADDFR
jgi:uncharacterized protein YbjT (DUF2867 family)